MKNMNTITTRILGWGLLFLITACQPAANKETEEKIIPEPIKGAWLTNVASDILTSREKIDSAMVLAKASGLTHICVVTWNNGYTMYPSAVLEKYMGVKMDPLYGDRDPLKEVIASAHAQGLKVIAWFEFGFSSSYGKPGTPILEKYPQWAAKDREGKVLVENGFTWMNSFLPEVQDFLTEMITEVVKNYDVDGIQGDDRLPAAPVRGGYDDFTTTAYASEHEGAAPPQDYADSNWVQWRANRMTAYARDLYKTVKAIKPNVLVAHAPSIYPWSKEHYLQDWPTWLDSGYTDVVMPQVYRYNYEAYSKTLDALITQTMPQYEGRVFPGVLTSLGDGYRIDEALLDSCIRYNRSKGIKGEVFFYFEGLRQSPDFYQNKYPKY